MLKSSILCPLADRDPSCPSPFQAGGGELEEQCQFIDSDLKMYT